jgi:ATP-dependent DNA helicase RecG
MLTAEQLLTLMGDLESDRVERTVSTNPENFPRQTDYRNPVIAEAMATLGYVNAYGRGVLRSQDALAKNGNPPAEFAKDEPTQFLATIRRKP